MCVSAAGGTPQRLLSDVTNPQFSADGRLLALLRVVNQRAGAVHQHAARQRADTQAGRLRWAPGW